MADETTADESYASGEENRITSLDELRAKLDWVIGKLSGGGEAKAQPQEDAASVEEKVRAELARAQKEEAQREAAAKEKAEQENLKATVAKLAEKPPAQPVPRRQKFLGWGE